MQPTVGAAPAWSLKHIHRLIVNSSVYRQSSRVSPELLEKDQYNRLLARAPRLRVEGEVVQDIWNARPFGKDPYGREIELPFERAGTLMVFKTFDKVSYALVIGARAPMQVADRVYNP